MLNGEHTKIVRRMAGMMNHRERLVLSLHYSDELSAQEIGCLLGMTEGEVAWMIETLTERARDAVSAEAA